MKENSFRVSELNNLIKEVLNAGFPRSIWVCGEIQQYDRNKTKKHIFFELAEKDPNSKEIFARIGLVIFANTKARIENILKKSENAFELKDDIEVKFECKVDFYPGHGQVRLIVEDIDPIYTLGKLAQEKQKLIALLKKKGLLDKNKQLELPLVPLKIGLITAFDSAAYNDFISEIKKSGFAFKIFIRNVLVQGKNAPADICRALIELNKIDGIDALVITRGGGSIADLNCFDSEQIIEKIAESRYPILSGIGHEINLCITDLAAHTYAKTPTAIAQFLVQKVNDFIDYIDEKSLEIKNFSSILIEKEKQNLRNSAIAMQNVTTVYLKEHNEKVVRLKEGLKYWPCALMKNSKNLLNTTNKQLISIIKIRLQNDNNRVIHYQKLIDIVSPINILKKGFSVTRNKDGKLIKKVSDTEKKQIIVTELIDGSLNSEVI